MVPRALLTGLLLASFQLRLPPQHPVILPDTYAGQEADLALARRFAPVFHQRLTPQAETHRFDFITNFDFDGDWVGNNNWEHAGDPKFPMRAFVYYSVVESESHYFLTYAAFHARDWSLVQPLLEGALDKVQQSEKLGKYLPPELREEIEVNHENDLEGAQVIVAKTPEVRVVGVETLAHNRFYPYKPEDLFFDGEHPHLYVESQKHGIHKYPYEPPRGVGMVFDSLDGPLRVYRYKGQAEDPEKAEDEVGYDLLPLYSTLWMRARNLTAPNQTFGEIASLGDLFCQVLGNLAQRAGPLCRLPNLGVALRGDVSGKNRARLPWGWFSVAEPALSNGAWFLDPVRLLRLHFPDQRGTEQYLSNPFLGVFREP